jgi:CheY-like chemotaxis protein
VASGVDALEALRRRPQDFDALVSDIGMPNLDGYELIRRVRAELGLPPERLPGVALTAYAREEDRARALEAGFQAHITKPYQIGQLVATLQHLQAVQHDPPSNDDRARRRADASVA